MRKGWKIAAIVAMVAILGVATVGVVAYAQEATTGSSAIWDFGQKVKEAIAEALGISVEQYEETVTTAQQQVLDEAVAEGQLTQEQADRMQKHLDESDGFRMPGMRGEPKGTSLLMTVAAEELGMTEAELQSALRDGKSIADLAEEKGVDVEVISNAYLEQLQVEMDQQMADGSLTQEEADAELEQKTEALPDRLTGIWSDPRGGREGVGLGGFRGGHGEVKSLLMTVAAEELGMTEAELQSALQDGKSIADLAEEKGVDVEVISNAYLEQLQAELDQQVADGSLTQEEADAKLEQKTEALPDRLTGAWNYSDRPSRGGFDRWPDDAQDITGEGEL